MAVNPPRTPPPPRLPHPGVAGAPAGTARNQLTSLTSSRPSTSPSSPTWASVVRGEAREGIPACSGPQPAAISVADFSALYERCVASGLKASLSFSHAAGVQVITITCNVPVPAATDTAAGRRRRRRRRKRRRRRAATAAREGPVPPSSSSPAAVAAVLTAGSTPPARSRTPPAPPTPPSPETQPPPSKRTRRRRNELELLRDSVDDNEIVLSPLSPSGPAKPPSATPPATRHVTSSTYTSPTPLAQPFNTAPPMSEALSPIQALPAPPTPPSLPDSPLQLEPAKDGGSTPSPSTLPPSATPAPPSDTPMPTEPTEPAASNVEAISTIPVAPPMSAHFPSCYFKVICRYCLRDSHDIRYKQCPGCYRKMGGNNYSGW
jgi:hypothetical protein